jgi:hypothetical protein
LYASTFAACRASGVSLGMSSSVVTPGDVGGNAARRWKRRGKP